MFIMYSSGKVDPTVNMKDKQENDSTDFKSRGKYQTELSVSNVSEDPSEVSTRGCYTECCSPETSPLRVSLVISACAFAGVVFGWCMEKSRVFEPESIRLQMVFERWIMLKMFIAAMASGQFVLSLLSIIPATKKRFEEANACFAGCFTDKGLISSITGAFVLGIGMTLSGACPGMVLPQVGSWTKNSIFTLLGVLIGALSYGLVAPYIVKFTKPKAPFKVKTIHDKFGAPFAMIALPSCLVMFVVVFLLEWFIPWQEDLPPQNRNYNNTNIITVVSWPPSVSGVLLGLLQMVIVLAVTDTLGGSTSYQTLVSQWVVGPTLTKTFPYLAKYRCGIGNWWQVVYVLAAMLGGFLSALSSDTLATTKGVTIPAALGGGFLLLVGARFASGCTSGHGLSGGALLYWLSLIAIPSMFAGGIATAFTMRATGALDHYDCFGSC